MLTIKKDEFCIRGEAEELLTEYIVLGQALWQKAYLTHDSEDKENFKEILELIFDEDSVIKMAEERNKKEE